MATRKGEAARDRILAAAWDEIDDLGVEQLLAGVSIRDVAARAGVAPSSVTYHFGTTAEVRRGAIFDQEQIARAVELGLGVAGPGAIELLTGDADGAAYARTIRAVLDGA